MSELKCSASASSASLEVALATRLSTRARKKSTTIEPAMMAKAAASLRPRAPARHQPLHRFPDHHAREQEQQRRLGERRDALDLAVAVLMLGVGRLAGKPHREIGQHRRGKIDQRMAGLGQDRERAGQKPDHGLRRRQARPRRRSSRARLFPCRSSAASGRDGLTAATGGVNARALSLGWPAGEEALRDELLAFITQERFMCTNGTSAIW